MTRHFVLFAFLAITGCFGGICESSCREKYYDCLDTGRTDDECAAMHANCVKSCDVDSGYVSPDQSASRNE